MNEDDIKKLIEIILKDAKLREENAGLEGGMHDGGSGRLRDQVKFFMYGYEMIIPPEWKQYHNELDPEYEKYLELKKKFGK